MLIQQLSNERPVQLRQQLRSDFISQSCLSALVAKDDKGSNITFCCLKLSLKGLKFLIPTQSLKL